MAATCSPDTFLNFSTLKRVGPSITPKTPELVTYPAGGEGLNPSQSEQGMAGMIRVGIHITEVPMYPMAE